MLDGQLVESLFSEWHPTSTRPPLEVIAGHIASLATSCRLLILCKVSVEVSSDMEGKFIHETVVSGQFASESELIILLFWYPQLI